MSETENIADFTPYVRIHLLATILYMHHATKQSGTLRSWLGILH